MFLLKIGGPIPSGDVIMMLIEASAYRPIVEHRTPLDETSFADVERLLSGKEEVYHFELRRAQTLV